MSRFNKPPLAGLILLFIIQACTSVEPEPATLKPAPHPNLSLLDESAQFPVPRQQALEEAASQKTGPEGAAIWGELGMLYHAYHIHEAALTCYANAYFLDGSDHRWLYLSGIIQQILGNRADAIKMLSASIQKDTHNTPAMITLAQLELLNNNIGRAGELFEQAYRQETNQTAALVGMGKVAARKDQHQKAIDLYKKALEEEPEANIIHYLLAMSYRDLGDLSEAQKHMALRGETQAHLDDPILAEVHNQRNDSESLRSRGNQVAASGRFAEALEYYRQSLNINPQDPRTWINVGLCCQQLNQTPQAIEAYENVLKYSSLPNLTATAHYRLGDLLEGQGDLSFKHYKAALQANSNLPAVMFRYAESLREAGQFRDALPYYQKILSQKPDFNGARLGRALSLIKLGQWSQAKTSLAEDMEAVREQPVFVHLFARLLAACPDDSIRNGSQALQLTTAMVKAASGAELSATHAMALAENGRFEDAIQFQRKAISLAVEASEPVEHLQQQLLAYLKGKPCREPLTRQSPLFTRKNY